MLSAAHIGALLEPYAAGEEFSTSLYDRLETYLALLLKWNARTNLTAIRDPEEMVRRHFGESLFAGRHLSDTGSGPTTSVLDIGSGAGFPGVPIQLLHPSVHVTLAESQGKKVAFLREAVRVLELSTEISAQRIESMTLACTFDVVALRAVDNMALATAQAAAHASRRILLLTTTPAERRNASSGRGGEDCFTRNKSAQIPKLALDISAIVPKSLCQFRLHSIPIPQTANGILLIGDKSDGPHGTI